MKIFGIDPGSGRTGYGCIETDGSRHRIVLCGAITTSASASFPHKLLAIHSRLAALLADCRPDCVAIENLFHANNARSALKLGHARGVAMLAAVETGVEIFEYTPAEIKRAVVGYGRAEKHQVQEMVKLILGLAAVPSPHDAADALAVAICHVHARRPDRVVAAEPMRREKTPTTWRAMTTPAAKPAPRASTRLRVDLSSPKIERGSAARAMLRQAQGPSEPAERTRPRRPGAGSRER